MIGIYRGKPCIFDSATGEPVLLFTASAAGWSRAIRLALEIQREISR